MDKGGVVLYGIDEGQVVRTGDTFVPAVFQWGAQGRGGRGGAVFIAFYVLW